VPQTFLKNKTEAGLYKQKSSMYVLFLFNTYYSYNSLAL